MFDRVAEHHSMSAVVVEYAGNIGLTGKCDPCAADAMTNKELVELGARWIGSEGSAPNAPLAEKFLLFPRDDLKVALGASECLLSDAVLFSLLDHVLCFCGTRLSLSMPAAWGSKASPASARGRGISQAARETGSKRRTPKRLR
jgi:hypothetical protein